MDRSHDHARRGAAFGSIFAGKRVLITGHTGFKGGWLTLWLTMLGATVRGVALRPETRPNLHDIAHVGDHCDGRIADINDPAALHDATHDFQADLVIHMAAQAIVRDSYDTPALTFMTNVMGTVNVLDLVRNCPSVKGVVVVTSDKCYENREWDWGYRETDPLGGSDPYSVSKACTELVVQSYRRSFFHDPAGPRLATVRAGNVIGGGDWAPHRLIPDIVRAAQSGRQVVIRNPESVRPWQHVLEPLAGYLTVAARLLTGQGDKAAQSWNFGPDTDATLPVGDMCRSFARHWGDHRLRFAFDIDSSAPHEAGLLRLDSTKARLHLGWRPQLSIDDALSLTAKWYRAFVAGDDMARLTLEQIATYQALLPDTAAPAAPQIFAAE